MNNYERITKDIESFQKFICDNIPNCYQVCPLYTREIKCREKFKQWLQAESDE